VRQVAFLRVLPFKCRSVAKRLLRRIQGAVAGCSLELLPLLFQAFDGRRRLAQEEAGRVLL